MLISIRHNPIICWHYLMLFNRKPELVAKKGPIRIPSKNPDSLRVPPSLKGLG
jgi:hypothetical protein